MPTPLHHTQPLYRQVAERILRQLAEGELAPGQYLPSEWDLARLWGVSQGTVRKGLSALVAQGVLLRQQGVGTCVTDKNPEWGDYPLAAETVLLRPQTPLQWPRSEVLRLVSAAADEETAVQLQLRPQAPVWRLTLLWRNGHQPVALDDVFLPQALLPELNRQFVHRRLSIHHFLHLHYGWSLRPWRQMLAWQPLPTEAARLLKAEAGQPACCWHRLSGAALPLEWRRRYLLASAGLLVAQAPPALAD